MNKTQLRKIAASAIADFCPHIRNTFDSWCEFDPGKSGMTFRSFKSGTTTHAFFEFISPVLYFEEMVGFTFNVEGDTATFSVSFGSYCHDAELAEEYAKRAQPFLNALGWSILEEYTPVSSLIISNTFSFSGEEDLLQKLIKRMHELRDFRMTSELLPTLHYFDDKDSEYY